MAEQKFEDAMKKLEEIVQNLESGDLPLEDALNVFEEGTKLSKFCSSKLEEAEKRVNVLVRDVNGKYNLEPFEVDGESHEGRKQP
ncbi:MAG: exodeoxyribonuclease VII small subunit [Desulfobacteraceae bacterium 4484_190.1]|nr:MAG: exodeoxyribonuclease VII small subunit [Desulfobacteraceae bacterium 4484_190.1]